MKVKVLRTLRRDKDGHQVVFAERGDVIEIGELDPAPDWLVGCPTAKYQFDDGYCTHLGQGYDFDLLERSPMELRPGIPEFKVPSIPAADQSEASAVRTPTQAAQEGKAS